MVDVFRNFEENIDHDLLNRLRKLRTESNKLTVVDISFEIKRILSVVLCSCNIQRIFLSTFSKIMKVIHFRLEDPSLFFLHLMKILKHLSQTKWLKTIKNSECVTAHMYRLSFLTIFASIRSIFLSTLYSLMYNKMI